MVFSLPACQNPVELGFALDGTSSVSPVELNLMTELVSDTVGFLEMSTRVGVMEYSESATVWIRFVLLSYWITKYFQARIIPSSGEGRIFLRY